MTGAINRTDAPACVDCNDVGEVWFKFEGWRATVEPCAECEPCEGACGRRVGVGEGFCAACVERAERGE